MDFTSFTLAAFSLKLYFMLSLSYDYVLFCCVTHAMLVLLCLLRRQQITLDKLFLSSLSSFFAGCAALHSPSDLHVGRLLPHLPHPVEEAQHARHAGTLQGWLVG
jgi:hypothetical protein